ncbi:MAG: hypothetical protein BGO90_15050 [Legionella sp. 40-6]|nr:MAG: hypothetical protein BGO90_15050 [Legionella sp. 40-6]
MSKLYKELCEAIIKDDTNKLKIILSKLKTETRERVIDAFKKNLNASFLTLLANSKMSKLEKDALTASLNDLGYLLILNNNNNLKRPAPEGIDEDRAAKKLKISRNEESRATTASIPSQSSQEFFYSLVRSHLNTANTGEIPKATAAGISFIEELQERRSLGDPLRLFPFKNLVSLNDLNYVAKELHPLLEDLDSESKTSFSERFLKRAHTIINQYRNLPTPGYDLYPFISSYIKLITLNEEKEGLTMEQLISLFTKYDYSTFVAIGDLYSLNPFMKISNFYQLMMDLDSELILKASEDYKQNPKYMSMIFHQKPQNIVSALKLRLGKTASTDTSTANQPYTPAPKTKPAPECTMNVQVNNYFILPSLSNYPPAEPQRELPTYCPQPFLNPNAAPLSLLSTAPYSRTNQAATPHPSAFNQAKKSQEKLQAPRQGIFQAPDKPGENNSPTVPKRSNIYDVLN